MEKQKIKKNLNFDKRHKKEDIEKIQSTIIVSKLTRVKQLCEQNMK